MNDASGRPLSGEPARRLGDAIRDVRNAAADRADVIVDMRDAQRGRLELLAAELAPVFAEVDRDDPTFDFAISSGLNPRLWIDAVAHVAMARDKRAFRFVRDTRIGRVVIAESADIRKIADSVTRYVAERVVERQRMMEGGVEPALKPAAAVERPAPAASARSGVWTDIVGGVVLVAAGAVAGILLMLAVFWEKLASFGGG